jgi:type IV pilus assembly protein PilM
MSFMGKPRGGPVVGVDIGSNTIKVVEVRGGANKLTVTAAGITPTPPGSVANGSILAPLEVGRAIKKAMAESGISTKSSISAVAGQTQLVVRVIDVPLMSQKELKEAMKWEVERHVPFAASEIVMDYAPLPPSDDSGASDTQEVLMTVAQESLINNHLEAIAAAGLQPKAIDIEPLAAARALINIDSDLSKRTVAIVNIGSSYSDFAIIREGVLVFPRLLPIAGNNLTKAVSDVLTKPLDEAENLKKQYARVGAQATPPPAATTQAPPAPAPTMMLDVEETAAPVTSAPGLDLDDESEAKPAVVSLDLDEETPELAPPPTAMPAPAAPTAAAAPTSQAQAEVSDAIHPVLVDLATEIRRSIDYYRSRSISGNVDKIIIFGGSAKMPGLAAFLTSELGMPVEAANLSPYFTAAGKLSPMAFDEMAPSLVVALGLASRDLIMEPPAPKPIRAPKPPKQAKSKSQAPTA